jgi:hypothetical protein
MRKVRRLPTIVGLLLVLAAIAGGVLLIKKGPNLFLRAAPELTPSQIKITNINDTSFTISWITDEETTGFIKYGLDKNPNFTANDDRDQLSGETESFLTHHATAKNLKPNTTYYFKIGSGGKIFDNNGQVYQIKTAPIISSSPPANDVAYGTIVDQNNNPVEGAIVYLSLANANPASTLSKSSGSWVIPLNLIRSADLSSYANYDKDASIEEIFIQASTLGTATVVATTKNDSPMPKITLGQNFDFRKIAEEETTTPEKEQESEEASATSQFKLEEATPSATVSADLEITNPEENEEVNAQKPQFQGTGPTGKSLTITVQSPTTYSGIIKTDENGNWKWIPPEDLEPGEHTVTVSYVDDQGKEQKVSKTFVILAAGESPMPAMTASPSGETTPSAESSPSAEASPSPTPTSSTESARTSIPSTEEGVPTSGYLTPTFTIFIMGISFIFIGLFLRKFNGQSA